VPFRSKSLPTSRPFSSEPDRLEILDVVVPFTTPALTHAALGAAQLLADKLGSLIRLVRIEEVPFPLPVESPDVSAGFLQDLLVPIAEQYGAHVQICFARSFSDGLGHVLSQESLIVVACRRRWFRFLRRTRQERLAKWLQDRGYAVVVEYVSES
jgi:hypothetical protein